MRRNWRRFSRSPDYFLTKTDSSTPGDYPPSAPICNENFRLSSRNWNLSRPSWFHQIGSMPDRFEQDVAGRVPRRSGDANGNISFGGADHDSSAGYDPGRIVRQRRRTADRSRALDDPARRAARPSRPDRHEEGLRSRPVRRLHGAGRRPAGQFLPDAGRHEGWRARHDHRGPGDERRAASAAAGLHRSRRVPVRLLHARTDLLGGRPDRRGQGQDRRRDPRTDERQHLPLRRLSQHRRGDPAGDERDGGAS